MMAIEKIIAFKANNQDMISENCRCRILCLSDGGDNKSRSSYIDTIKKITTI